jgi:dimethylhistidine N-methyltransferase
MSAPAPWQLLDLAPARDSFLDDVLQGLAAPAKALPPKYFYDARGSALFERICELPEYYPTRTELAMMRRHAAEMAAAIGGAPTLIEFGSGSGVKTEILIAALKPEHYLPVDISREALGASARRIAGRHAPLRVIAICADYTRLDELPAAAAEGGRLVYFPGSTIGNLTPEEALRFLRRARGIAGAGGAMLVGVDLKKDVARLYAAYNDAQGVTAEFNLNLLARINRELGADFDLAGFRHVAFYDLARGRIEMHLESLRAQAVTLAGRRYGFAAGERIHTENSCKYAIAEFAGLAAAAGFRPQAVWTDPERLFAVHLLRA